MLPYLLYFIFFGFLGWLIDTAYRSIKDKKYAPGTYFPYFAPIYGFGGISMIAIYSNLNLTLWNEIFLCTLAFIGIELVGGLFCTLFFKKRLWDYSASAWNFDGHIDVEHSIAWFIAAIICYFTYSFLIILS